MGATVDNHKESHTHVKGFSKLGSYTHELRVATMISSKVHANVKLMSFWA
jgi:hypothetical protein